MKQTLALLCFVGLFCGVAGAQDPNLVLGVAAPGAANGGSSFDASVTFDNTGASLVDGWSFGVCHDGGSLTLNSFANSALVNTINGGQMPGFGSTTLVSPAMGGTQGVVIDLFGVNKLNPGTGYTFVNMNYSAANMTNTTNIAICGTLGNPAVADIIVVGGGSITPTEVAASVSVTELALITLRVVAPALQNDNSAFAASVEFDNVGTDLVDGWSYGVCHDGSLLTLDSFANSALVATINGGMMPGFGATSIVSATTGGTQGIVIDLFGVNKLAPGTGYVFLDMGYTGADVAMDTNTTVSICNTLGNPPVDVVIVIGGGSFPPAAVSADITLRDLVAPEFIRGECNGDGHYNIADGIWTLNMLFQGGPSSSCVEACDANDDGSVDAADAMFTFFYQLLDGPAPSAPFPNCGTDPSDPIGADCANFAGC
ncbi:MAG: hypothetical protein AB7O52_14815 [Planctomycetota bacterium]